MAYKINDKKIISEQGTNSDWLTTVINYFNKMNEEQKKALENTLSLCTQCKSDMDNNKGNSQSCVACKSFYDSMNNVKKIKVTESQFDSVIKKLINNESSLLNENIKCYRKNLNPDATLKSWARCACSSGRKCKPAGPDWGPGMVVSGGEGTKGNVYDKVKHSKEASKHIMKLKESDLIKIIDRVINEEVGSPCFQWVGIFPCWGKEDDAGNCQPCDSVGAAVRDGKISEPEAGQMISKERTNRPIKDSNAKATCGCVEGVCSGQDTLGGGCGGSDVCKENCPQDPCTRHYINCPENNPKDTIGG